MSDQLSQPYLQLLFPDRTRDPRGDPFHEFFLAAFLFTLPFGTAVFAAAFAVAVGYTMLRAWATWPSYRPLFRQPLIWFALAWTALEVASLAWSSNPAQGRADVWTHRVYLPTLLAFWPIIDRWQRICRALGLAIILVAASQLLHRLGAQWIAAIAWPYAGPGRFPGFLHPSNTAVIELVAGSLAIVGAVRIHTRERFFWSLVAIASALGLALTGARSEWLAALIAWPASLIFAARSPRLEGVSSNKHLPPLRRPLTISIAALALLASSWLLPGITARLSEAGRDLRLAIVDKNYRTDLGARVAQARLAIQLWKQHPLIGVGVGAYYPQARLLVTPLPLREEAEGGLDAPSPATASDPSTSSPQSKPSTPVLIHAHSAFLQILATTGLLGVAIQIAFWSTLFLGSFRLHQHTPLAPAIPAAVIGLFIAFIFDAHNLSAPGPTLLFLLTAVILHDRISSTGPSRAPSTSTPTMSAAIRGISPAP